MTDHVRKAYAQAAEEAVRLLGTGEVAQRWEAGSVLPGMSVGALAGHLANSVLQVEWFLDGPVADAEPVSAVRYYGRLVGTTEYDSALNTGVRARSEETAAAGPAVVAEQARAAWERLEPRLHSEPADRRVAVLHRPGEEMLLDGYLRTRCVELAVHLEDLALSVDAPSETPDATLAVAVDVLVAAARDRHGDQAVLHALSRSERDTHHALRVL
ncbi:maleylpyruvate isomerase N-terminal domain-containing protein [Streptomyces sp. NBC_00237]|uniref:maleylpyruvate isomerase N-terminal domain-containing protein n=1 Tax=Streptomyces sp. NBC_00237 TaxID=2975687 RepID=UPI00225A997E|nr:maleylpyruvate isomerase N-terminal domain-containing protein [Streptomyces sp. NBC_00237]MCX5201391.1 maleylpyruvate isomerase N-terminal domain-containing protein [Streptomyces sp. NBC_00237]